MRRLLPPVVLVCLLGALVLPAPSGATPAPGVPAALTGGVWAWGANDKGQLSDGSVTDRGLPQAGTWRPGGALAPTDSGCPPLAADPGGERGLLYGKVAIAAGFAHTLTLNEYGEVWGWGANRSGQLGDGTKCDRDTQVRVPLPGKAVAIAAGAAHSLALLEDGTVWSWGAAGFGALGRGFVDDLPAASPEGLGLLPDGCTLIPPGCTADSSGTGVEQWWVTPPHQLPGRVPGLTGVTAIAAGGRHSLALTATGRVFAWGDNRLGQLGVGWVDEIGPDGRVLGRQTRQYEPLLVQLPVRDGARAIAAGDAHSLAVGRNGELWAWGSDNDSQLGGEEELDPACWCRFAPRAVAGLPAIAGAAAGAKHTLAWGAIGPVLAWGDNSLGQLGDGTTWSRHFPPAHVIGLDMGGFGSTKAIVAGAAHNLALNFDGSVTTWGANNRAQLGRLSPDYMDFDPTPRQVPALFGALAVAAGGAHSHAIGGEIKTSNIFEPEPASSEVQWVGPSPTALAAAAGSAGATGPSIPPVGSSAATAGPTAPAATATPSVAPTRTPTPQPPQQQPQQSEPAQSAQPVQATQAPPTQVPATATAVPATATAVPPTQAPPTSTPVPPTATTAPPTAVPPTATRYVIR